MPVLVIARGQQCLERLEGQIVGRARWAEDALARGLAAGVSQYVIIGAGLDSFVLRRSELLDRLQAERAEREEDAS